MGYLNACSFTFNGISSRIYDLRICWDGADSNVETGLEREIVKGEVNMVRHKANQYGTKYSSVISIDFMIMKPDGSDFTDLESRTINKWLQTDTYSILQFEKEDNYLYYKAICTNIEDRVYGGFCAKNLTFECDSPFAYESLRTFVKSDQENIMRVFNTSDDGIYSPTLSLKPLAVGEITITNTTDSNKSMVFDIPSEYINKTITIDTNKMQILDEDGVPIPFYKLGWEITPNITTAIQSNSFYWLRLLPEINRIQITGNCTLEIICEFPRKAGVL